MKLAIGAGHGLYTSGKAVPDYMGYGHISEWELDDKIVSKTIELLQEYENVEILRLDDPTGVRDVPLKERTDKANSWGADLLISNHHNAGIGGGSGGGTVIFRYPNSSFTMNQMQNLYDSLIARTGLRGNRSSPLQEENFHMVRESSMPAVLIEHGFMDSTSDMEVIMTEAFSTNSAHGIVDFLVDEFNLQKKQTDEDTGGENNDEEVPPDRYMPKSTVMRISNQNQLYLKNEIIEYPSEIEGGRNLAHEGVINMKNDGSKVTNTDSSRDAFIIDENAMKPETNYVLQWKMKLNSGTVHTIAGHSHWYNVDALYIDGEKVSDEYSADYPNDNQEHLIEIYFRTLKKDSSVSNKSFYFQPNRTAYDKSYSIQVWNVKLEEGNNPTPWTRAPEDLGYSIPNHIQHFRKSLYEDGTLLVTELNENNTNFRFNANGELKIDELIENA